MPVRYSITKMTTTVINYTQPDPETLVSSVIFVLLCTKDNGTVGYSSCTKDSGSQGYPSCTKDRGSQGYPPCTKDSGSNLSLNTKDSGSQGYPLCTKDNGLQDYPPCTKDSGSKGYPSYTKDSGSEDYPPYSHTVVHRTTHLFAVFFTRLSSVSLSCCLEMDR